jgi:hypothetical protein
VPGRSGSLAPADHEFRRRVWAQRTGGHFVNTTQFLDCLPDHPATHALAETVDVDPGGPRRTGPGSRDGADA